MKEVVDRIVQYPNRYKLTDVSTGQEMGTYDFTEVPGTVQQEGTEINAELFASIEQDIENAGNFDPNGTYQNLTAGEAIHAQSADTAGYATTAKGDANGNDIAATYATKAELAAAGQFDPNGTYPNLTAGDAMHAASADAATKASQDASGNDIVATYATKTENAAKLDAPTVEQFSVPTTSWTALSGADPFTVSATVTATTPIGADATIELYNDKPVAFSQYCFSIAAVSGQTLTIYALETPTSAVTLTVGITN